MSLQALPSTQEVSNNRATITWDEEPVKESAREAIDNCIDKTAPFCGMVVKLGVAASGTVVVDCIVKPVIKICSGKETPEGCKPFLDSYTGGAIADTSGPVINSCVKSTADVSKKALKKVSDCAIDNTRSCINRVASWS